MAKRRRAPAPLPSKDDILRFIRESPDRVGRRDIARAFRVTGSARAALGSILSALEREGHIGRRTRPVKAGALPRVAVIEVTGTDADGEVLGRPVKWPEDVELPKIYLAPDRHGLPTLGEGERVLARLEATGEGAYEAHTIRRFGAVPREVLGVYALIAGRGRVVPTDRRAKSEFIVDAADSAGARPGELVRAQSLARRALGLRQAKVIERIGSLDDTGAISLIAIHGHDIPSEFPPAALARAAAARPAPLGKRADLRELPLVTIDDEDARDFDDAVWAEPDPNNRGGWRLVVAIADVAHYVRPGDDLDQCARERGNSVYLPDRVVPMLPERLSNGLCSLAPGEDRPCIAVNMWIDNQGKRVRHEFVRAMMRSAARLTYAQAQSARDGAPDDVSEPLLETVIAPLYGAYGVLRRARQRRGALDIELPEYRVIFDAKGEISRIAPRAHRQSHQLVEEFMIAANVAAAETLEDARVPCMYRVHDRPARAKVESLRDFLASLGYNLARGQMTRARQLSEILRKAADTPHARLVGEAVLRSQAQAVYSPENIGHFGLALRRYAHFTSPIRRYADLLVHRALISALNLGEGGLAKGVGAAFAEIGEHLSMTERRAVAAERDAMDRFSARYLANRLGARFTGRIVGVTRFGLFVALDETGAEGLVPMRTLDEDRFVHDESRHRLIGRHRGKVHALGDAVEVRLAEADAVTGGLVFHLLDLEGAAEPRAGRNARRNKRA